MDVVALDLTRLSLHWASGAKDPSTKELATHYVPGLVPAELQPHTLFVFNGGFQPRHGRWGIQAHGSVVQPLKDNGCVVAIRSADSPGPGVVLGPWEQLAVQEAAFVVVRQTPPCLLQDAEIHPDLLRGRAKPWAGQNKERRTRRRSALGIDASQRILFFAVGSETEAVDLARGMKAVGAHTALELDINWNWTRFLVAGETEHGRRITAALLSEMAYGAREYFGRPSDRDFFFVTRAP